MFSYKRPVWPGYTVGNRDINFPMWTLQPGDRDETRAIFQPIRSKTKTSHDSHEQNPGSFGEISIYWATFMVGDQTAYQPHPRDIW